MRRRTKGAVAVGAVIALAGCATSTNLTVERADEPDLTRSYMDTRVVVTAECPSSEGRKTTTAAGADVGEIFGGLATSVGERVIDLGIDALSEFVKNQAEPSHGTVSAGSNSYLWVDKVGGDQYIGCVTLVHGLMSSNNTEPVFSDFWKAHEAKSKGMLQLPLARDPQLYIEANAVLSTDRTAMSLVPTYFYYGEPLDDRGTDTKKLVVRYDLWSPTVSGKDATDQTLIIGAGTFDLPAVEPPTVIDANGFGLKHTPWFGLPKAKKGNNGEPDESEPISAPPDKVCLPEAMTGKCVRRGTFNQTLRDTDAALPVYVQATVTEDGGKSAFWNFLKGIFTEDIAAKTKQGLKAVVFPPAKTAAERTTELTAAVSRAEAQATAQKEVEALTKTIEQVQNDSSLTDAEKTGRLNVLRAQLALAKCKASGDCA